MTWHNWNGTREERTIPPAVPPDPPNRMGERGVLHMVATKMGGADHRAKKWMPQGNNVQCQNAARESQRVVTGTYWIGVVQWVVTGILSIQ